MHMRVLGPHARYRYRSGSAYVFILMVATFLTIIGISGMMLGQVNGRAVSLENDATQAGVLAESAVELALTTINSNSSWRTAYTSGTATTPLSAGRGTMSFKLVDEVDGNIATNTNPLGDPVRIYGIGVCGKATRVYSVQASPTSGKAYTCLSEAVAVSGNVNLISATISPPPTGSVTVAANGGISATLTTLTGVNLQSASSINIGLLSSGTITSNATALTFPTAATVFNYYTAAGTTLTAVTNNILTGYQITNCLLSPANNPFGGVLNAKGIYVLNCGGSAATISNCRIVGTLVLTNTSGVTISNSVEWEPAVSGMPCLMVQGNLSWSTSSSALLESSNSTNLNPTGTPYPYNFGSGGVSNASTSDAYPSQIDGLVYCSGNLSISNTATLNAGVVVVGGAYSSTAGTFNLAYDSTYANNPPPGFAPSYMQPAEGTWKWEKGP